MISCASWVLRRVPTQVLGVGKLYETLLAVIPILVLTLLSGADLRSLSLVKGNLNYKWGLGIGTLLVVNYLTSVLIFFGTGYEMSKLGSADSMGSGLCIQQQYVGGAVGQGSIREETGPADWSCRNGFVDLHLVWCDAFRGCGLYANHRCANFRNQRLYVGFSMRYPDGENGQHLGSLSDPRCSRPVPVYSHAGCSLAQSTLV